ncbi:helix-turn-helix transcriptional regulator [Paraburkholderia domus]|uniref:helix-turn-helix transcriptional regulator n=1 Tax=Paraburkholderia domus TaxID=2793075 RepID=UPI001B8D6109|nr:hypothetical protein [Paraburkholderia domus]
MQEAKWSAQRSIGQHEAQCSERDFRAVFGKLDASTLITADELAAILCVSRQSIDFRLRAGKIPRPVVREKRCVRWRAGDVREWLDGMQQVE